MQSEDRLPLVVQSLELLVNKLTESDRVAIVVYAGASGLVLPPTSGDRKDEIRGALRQLSAGGSTNGSGGIELAYRTALENFVKDGNNRVILATDGDFNVGVTDNEQLEKLIVEKAKSKVFLTVLGFGMGNHQDSTLERLADRGNGNHAYIDDLGEARKVLVEQMGGTLIAVAKDVKVQVEFNPLRVASWRQIGYENRALAARDFNDDTKDAGELGAGHSVTALYEIVPTGAPAGVDPLRYQKAPADSRGEELLTVKVRHQKPEGSASRLSSFPLRDRGAAFVDASDDFRFAAAVAAFGMVLRGSEHKGDATLSRVMTMAEDARGTDPGSYRSQFLDLVDASRKLSR